MFGVASGVWVVNLFFIFFIVVPNAKKTKGRCTWDGHLQSSNQIEFVAAASPPPPLP
jgi:hypothetical protein